MWASLTLDSWISAARDKDAGGVLSREERDEIRGLKAQNRELVMRVDLGKKAAAFFATDALS